MSMCGSGGRHARSAYTAPAAIEAIARGTEHHVQSSAVSEEYGDCTEMPFIGSVPNKEEATFLLKH